MMMEHGMDAVAGSAIGASCARCHAIAGIPSPLTADLRSIRLQNGPPS